MSSPKLQANRITHLFGNIPSALVAVRLIKDSLTRNSYAFGQGDEYSMTQGEYWDEVEDILKLRDE